MNKKSKILSALIAVIMILLSSGTVSAFADGEFEIPVKIKLETETTTISSGEVFKVDAGLDFNEQDISGDNDMTANGIVVFRYLLKYDRNLLDMVDPSTEEPLEFFGDGTLVSGNFYEYGEIGEESAFSVNTGNTNNVLVVLYAAKNETGDIYIPGTVARFAFKAKEDLEINEYTFTKIEIADPDVAVNNKNVKINASKGDLDLRIVPPYAIQNLKNVRQNETLTATGSCYLGTDSEEPLMAKIMQGDNVIGAEKQADLTDTRFKVSFDLPETDFPTGNYKLVLSHGKTSLSRSFEVLPKLTPAEPTTPDPSGPTDPDDGKRDDDKKDDNNTGGGTNTGGSRNNGTGGTNQTKPDNTAESNKPADSGNKPQATIKYPSDLAGHWAESNVKYVYDNALMNGYSDGTFKPDASITRAEFSAVMARFLKLDDKASAAEKFGDVKGHWAIGYIGALADKGIVGGVIENSFAPDDNITREQMAAILSRAFDLKETSPEVFADNGEISDWARDYVYACRKAGYMNGDAVNNFSPLDNASRAEVATVIYRLHSAK